MKFPKLESIVIHDFIPSQENLANLLSLIKNNEKTLKKITILNGFTEEELHIIQQELEQYPHIHLKITYRPIMSPETLKKNLISLIPVKRNRSSFRKAEQLTQTFQITIISNLNKSGGSNDPPLLY